MLAQSQLPLNSSLPPVTRKEPRLWVKSFAVYSELKPDKCIRRVTLKKGLNIIWAKNSESGASGHAAGKSTFCRMLRYLLGDSSFGSEDFKHSFRDQFPEAYVVGEVYLDNASWLLVRTLSTHGKRQSSKDTTLEGLFEEKTVFSDYQDFIEELESAFISPLAADAYPGSGRKVEWKHLLHWLTRDQDARFAHLLDWRTSQQNRDLKLSAADKTNLIRMVASLLDPEELAQQALHSDLQGKAKELDGLIPKLEYLKTRTALKIGERFPLKEDNLEFQYGQFLKESKEALKSVSEEWKAANSTDGIDEFTKASWEQACREVTRLKQEICNAQNRLRRYEVDHQLSTGAINEEQRKIELSKMEPFAGLCSVPLHEAENCPHAAGPERDELQKQKLEQTKTGAAHLESLIETVRKQIATAQHALRKADTKASKLEEKVTRLKTTHATQRKKISDKAADVSSNISLLEEALADWEDVETKRSDQTQLKKDLEESAGTLRDLRKSEVQQLSQLSDYFSTVASALLNEPVKGGVRFNSEEILPSLNYAGDMSSAALVTLRLLIFDLSCLIGSQYTLANHPGFLVHDSPREADLSAAIYSRIFTLIAGPPENEAVQYIIATTEP